MDMLKRILVIDDDEDILEILNIVFQEQGYEVVISNTGSAAEDIEVIDPDLVLLDVRITGSAKNGAEICAEIKSQHKKKPLPVILVSGESDLAILASECGADTFIPKPFDINDMVIRVKLYV
jgi:two-component system response regulator VicR